jgi:hypothetical protein
MEVSLSMSQASSAPVVAVLPVIFGGYMSGPGDVFPTRRPPSPRHVRPVVSLVRGHGPGGVNTVRSTESPEVERSEWARTDG